MGSQSKTRHYQELRKDPIRRAAYNEHQRLVMRERLSTPEGLQKHREHQTAYLANHPEQREKSRQRGLLRYYKIREDPNKYQAMLECNNENRRKRAKDPEFREKARMYNKTHRDKVRGHPARKYKKREG